MEIQWQKRDEWLPGAEEVDGGQNSLGCWDGSVSLPGGGFKSIYVKYMC